MKKLNNGFTLIELIVCLLIIAAVVGFALPVITGMSGPNSVTPISDSGVKKVQVKVETQSNGRTIEQDNVAQRLQRDNKIGSLKHLYVISSMTGDVLIYSTVKGKVTSSGKRLTPTSVLAANANSGGRKQGVKVNLGGTTHRTSEVLQDDGTYGSSVPYVYWFDQRGVYHQHYITGGQIFHVTDAPLSVAKAIINMELE